MEEACKKYSEMGISGFKIDFLDRDDQTAVEMTYRIAEMTAKYKLKKWYEQQGKIQTEGSGQEEKAARRPDSGQEGYYVQAEWNAFLEQIFSMQELLIWKFYYENGFSCAEIGEKIGISESNTKVKLFRMRQKFKNCMEE